MAGGIDWFRWHHGSVTDPKFQLVARKSGASLPDVLAVWVWLLEKASAADFRGCFGEVDCEALDCLFGFDDGVTDSIMAAMVDRKLIADEYVVAWEKRQPKREDDNATERKRQQREREAARAASVTGGESRTVTQSHAESRADTQGHAREEERREEEKREDKDKDTAQAPASRKRGALPSVPASALESVGFTAEVAAEFIAYRHGKKAPLTERAWSDHCREADKAGFTPQQAAEKVMAKGWRGFEAAYVARDRPPFGPSAQPGGLVTLSQHGLQTMRAAEALEKRLFGGMDAAA